MRRERRNVVANEPVGPYTLLRVTRGGIDPGIPGQFFMLEAPGRILPRPMSLCLAPAGELAFLIDPVGPGTHALCELGSGDELHLFGPLGSDDAKPFSSHPRGALGERVPPRCARSRSRGRPPRRPRAS